MSQCQVPTQEFSNGFCYDKCPAGYSPYSSGLCLQNCPTNFVDHGTACQPPSVIRKSSKTTISKCEDNQIDRNGNCFEPQTINTILLNGQEVPKVTGCGCIRKTLAQRIQCPNGFTVYNNSCVSACPTGYKDIKDKNGNITSMYCIAECPVKITNASERWKYIGGLCVKDYTSRLSHNFDAVSHKSQMSLTKFIEVPIDGIPQTMVSYLANRPLGSSLNDRNRVGQSVSESLGANNPFSNPFSSSIGDSWLSLIFDPAKLAFALIIFGLIIFGGPSLFPLLAKGLGSIVKGVGIGVGSVTEGAGSLVKSAEVGTGKLTEGVLADVGKTVEAQGNKAIARSLQAEASATDVATTAQENLARASKAARSAAGYGAGLEGGRYNVGYSYFNLDE